MSRQSQPKSSVARHGTFRDTFLYFARFDYPPTLLDLYRYHPAALPYPVLKQQLQASIEEGVVVVSKQDTDRFIMPSVYTSYRSHPKKVFSNYKKKHTESLRKRGLIHKYLQFLGASDHLLFAGISGSLAKNNAGPEDDIDICIITEAGRLFTARLYALFSAWLFGVKRKRSVEIAPDKACLNLFLDRRNLAMPQDKQTRYVAHEIIQLDPVINKKDSYQQLFAANPWVLKHYPNALDSMRYDEKAVLFSSLDSKGADVNKLISMPKAQEPSPPRPYPLEDRMETLLKSIQMKFIRRHRTHERISDTQLWFFPKDYEETIVKTKRVVRTDS